MQIGNIGGADDFGDRPLLVVVTDRAIEGFIRADIDFRLVAEQRRHAGLRIEIDGQHPVTAQRQILRHMRRRRRLAGTALEIHHSDDLKRLVAAPMRQVAARTTAALVEMLAQFADVFDAIGTAAAPAAGGKLRHFRRHLP